MRREFYRINEINTLYVRIQYWKRKIRKSGCATKEAAERLKMYSDQFEALKEKYESMYWSPNVRKNIRRPVDQEGKRQLPGPGRGRRRAPVVVTEQRTAEGGKVSFWKTSLASRLRHNVSYHKKKIEAGDTSEKRAAKYAEARKTLEEASAAYGPTPHPCRRPRQLPPPPVQTAPPMPKILPPPVANADGFFVPTWD